MFSVSVLAAAVTICFVPPDAEYPGYFDLKSLVCLFSVLVIVRALTHTGFFDALAVRLIRLCGNLRTAVFMLTAVTLVSSMLITNDMALIAFLPLSYYVLKQAKAERYLAYLFIVQTMAANLGGMILPFGSPHNLYLYTYFNIPVPDFLRIMFPLFAVSVVLIAICCVIVKPIKAEIGDIQEPYNVAGRKRLPAYIALFIVVALAIFRVLPYPAALIAPAAIVFLDRQALKETDYALIGTFCAFFVFSGNLARIPAIQAFLSDMTAQNALLMGVGASQVISNVPASILLSKFTVNFAGLLRGVNIGGVGSPVGSLASLITISHFMRYKPGDGKHFAALFAALNIAFLALLLAIFAGLPAIMASK
jgi:Na+/H+ antiporter NhaD/arsenite permease-like protein